MTDEGLLVLIGLGIGFVIIMGYIYFKSKVAYLEGLNESNRMNVIELKNERLLNEAKLMTDEKLNELKKECNRIENERLLNE